MYINFHKYNYQTVAPNERKAYEERDKEAYKNILTDWLQQNLNSCVERKWEIEEIHFLKDISDFIKLIREAESLYELGFFTGCIALTGVSAEDFSRFLSIKNGLTVPDKETQFTRLGLQLKAGIIDQATSDLLHEIREIRNDCLHYNQDFKQKNTADLQADAIKALNNLKKVLKSKIGTVLKPEYFTEVLEELFALENTRNFEELVWKQKNMFSHLFHFGTALHPSVETVEKTNVYLVLDIDDEEVSLQDNMGLIAIVDLDETGMQLAKKYNIKKGDYVFAAINSTVEYDGQTRLWFLKDALPLPMDKNPFQE